MNTPIADFLEKYEKSGIARFHMPGHKGEFGYSHDITEIGGADDLFHAEGIIMESEMNATAVFDTRRTFYSTEGSSLCIRAMLYLALKYHASGTGRPFLLAGRNAHKTLILTAALLDFDIEWLYSEDLETTLCECYISPKGLRAALKKCEEEKKLPFAVFITSPNYLGQVAEIKELAEVAHDFGIPLLTDNAHGAYLKFLEGDFHPMELGADMCCDSAHKTLPALTGSAYLHIGKNAIMPYEEDAKDALALFGSTSPSYLILESLDKCNAFLYKGFKEALSETVNFVADIKEVLTENGFSIIYSEPLKIVIDCIKTGFRGKYVLEYLRRKVLEPEYADDDFIVLMVSPYNKVEDFAKLGTLYADDIDFLYGDDALRNKPEPDKTPVKGTQCMSVKEALFSKSEVVSICDAEGRICADIAVSCPPAIPVAVAGERLTKEHVKLLYALGHEKIKVIVK